MNIIASAILLVPISIAPITQAIVAPNIGTIAVVAVVNAVYLEMVKLQIFANSFVMLLLLFVIY